MREIVYEMRTSLILRSGEDFSFFVAIMKCDVTARREIFEMPMQ
jgi:hypothetical protein